MVKKLLLILLACVFFCSCMTTKKLKRDRTKTLTETTETVKRTRASDTLEMVIPKIVYKDTTIYKRGRTSTVYIKYDKQGNKKIGGLCDSINEVIDKRILEYKKNNIRDKDKETVINNEMILYVFLGFAGLIVVFKVVNKFI